MFRALFGVFLLATLVAGEETLSYNDLKEMMNAQIDTYSNNILEDANMDVPELIRKYGYPVEIHNLISQGGYILTLHRIPYGKAGNTLADRAPVFIMHGMFGSSADWVIAGPDKALGYVLADAGFDVWMGNARGTYYSRRHTHLNPDVDIEFWQFTWDEIGRLDLSASIDYILANTGKSQLHYVAHSQGGTTFFVLNSIRPEYNSRFLSVQLMAPAVFNTALDREMLAAVAPYLGLVEQVAGLFGFAEMFPNGDWLSNFALDYCKDTDWTQIFCTLAFHAFGGYSPMLNSTLIPAILGHTPAGASFRQIAHFGQVISTNNFARYDYGPITNLLTYGSLEPPKYNLNQVTAPVTIHFAVNDKAVVPEDLVTLHNALPNSLGLIQVEHSQFNHIDFLYGSGAKELVYDKIAVAMMGASPRNEEVKVAESSEDN